MPQVRPCEPHDAGHSDPSRHPNPSELLSCAIHTTAGLASALRIKLERIPLIAAQPCILHHSHSAKNSALRRCEIFFSAMLFRPLFSRTIRPCWRRHFTCQRTNPNRKSHRTPHKRLPNSNWNEPPHAAGSIYESGASPHLQPPAIRNR